MTEKILMSNATIVAGTRRIRGSSFLSFTAPNREICRWCRADYYDQGRCVRCGDPREQAITWRTLRPNVTFPVDCVMPSRACIWPEDGWLRVGDGQAQGIAMSLLTVANVSAWDLHHRLGAGTVHVFVDGDADAELVALALMYVLPATVATYGDERADVDAGYGHRVGYNFSRITTPPG